MLSRFANKVFSSEKYFAMLTLCATILCALTPVAFGKEYIPTLNHFASKENTYRFKANTLMHRMPKDEIG
jgi:hypothetical protein